MILSFKLKSKEIDRLKEKIAVQSQTEKYNKNN